MHAGGGAFITSAALSALGWDAALFTILPARPFDTVICADLAQFGVDISHCCTAEDGAAPQITVAIAGAKDRAFLSHKSGQAIPEAAIPHGLFRHLHIGELRTLVEHPELIEKARDAGMTISVDCGWDAELLAEGSEVALLLAKVDVFLPNQVEFTHLTNSGMAEGTCRLTVVKCGADGARAYDGERWISKAALKAKIVDTTGAGDAFNGGFLSGWLSGQPIIECLAAGNRCGRISVEQAGGTGGLLTAQQAFAAAQ